MNLDSHSLMLMGIGAVACYLLLQRLGYLKSNAPALVSPPVQVVHVPAPAPTGTPVAYETSVNIPHRVTLTPMPPTQS